MFPNEKPLTYPDPPKLIGKNCHYSNQKQPFVLKTMDDIMTSAEQQLNTLTVEIEKNEVSILASQADWVF